MQNIQKVRSILVENLDIDGKVVLGYYNNRNGHHNQFEVDITSWREKKVSEEYKVPKYYHIKQEIIKEIDNNTYKENETIPSERELMAVFDVSRITIRKAIDDLVKEGYLYRVHGKGTYVKGDGEQNNLVSITSCTQDIEKLGYTPRRKVISKKVILADAKRRNVLNLNEHEEVFQLARIYYADEEPLNYTTSYFQILICMIFLKFHCIKFWKISME